MSNRGTYDGDIQEVEFVKSFNKNKLKYKDYINQFNQNHTNVWMIRVTTKQLSKLSNQKVFTRADTFLVKCHDNRLINLLNSNDFYLDEDTLNANQIIYNFIPYSGVSVKMADSDNYQILKTGPHSFYNLFGSYELGAGISIFCAKDIELIKNVDLFKGWNTTIDKMSSYFSKFTNNDLTFYNNKDICKSIKKYSIEEITNKINSDTLLQQKIFNGYNLYDEPYTAWYFFHGLQITKLTVIPFSITTGSGRSHGDYTVVLKPKK